MEVPVQQTPVHHRRDYRIHLVDGGDLQSKHSLLLYVGPALISQGDAAATVLAGYNHLSELRRYGRAAARALE